MQTEMDFLVIGNTLIRKLEQEPWSGSAQQQFEMD
jgi:hypothetical protein